MNRKVVKLMQTPLLRIFDIPQDRQTIVRPSFPSEEHFLLCTVQDPIVAIPNWIIWRWRSVAGESYDVQDFALLYRESEDVLVLAEIHCSKLCQHKHR